jgi:hypothetical protein
LGKPPRSANSTRTVAVVLTDATARHTFQLLTA